MSVLSQIQVGSSVYDIQSIEFILGTQSSATNVWLGATESAALEAGKVIAYKLPYDGTSSNATLNLTLSGGTTSGAKNVMLNGSDGVTDEFSANQVILMLYDGTAWQVIGGGAGVESSGGEVVTTSANFVNSVSATTNTINTILQVNGSELVIGSATIVSGITSTVASAVTAVDNDSNITNAYGEYF